MYKSSTEIAKEFAKSIPKPQVRKLLSEQQYDPPPYHLQNEDNDPTDDINDLEMKHEIYQQEL